MPAQNIRSSVSGGAQVPANGYYPKLLQGASGSVWLVGSPKTGVIVHLSSRPQKSKHKIGYATAKLNEAKMSLFTGSVNLAIAA